MRRLPIVASFLVATASAALAGPEEDACVAKIEAARSFTATLPAGDLSRRYADNQLDTALTEMASGEVDDCDEYVERARYIVEKRPYVLRPGERLDVRAPETPR